MEIKCDFRPGAQLTSFLNFLGNHPSHPQGQRNFNAGLPGIRRTVLLGSDRPMSSMPLPEAAPSPSPLSGNVVSFDGTVIHYDLYERASRGLVVVIPGFWRDR